MADRLYYLRCTNPDCGDESVSYRENKQDEPCFVCHKGTLECYYSEGCSD